MQSSDGALHGAQVLADKVGAGGQDSNTKCMCFAPSLRNCIPVHTPYRHQGHQAVCMGGGVHGAREAAARDGAQAYQAHAASVHGEHR